MKRWFVQPWLVLAAAGSGLLLLLVLGRLARAAYVADLPGPALTELWCQNVDWFEPSYTVVDFYPQASGGPTSVVDPSLPPWSAHEFVARGAGRLALGRYAAHTTSDYSVVCAARTDWLTGGAAVAHEQSEPASALIVPVAYKRAVPLPALGVQSSALTIQNAQSRATNTATVRLYPDGGATPLVVVPLELAPGRSRTLDLASAPEFAGVADGFVGWAHITGAGPLAASATVEVTSDGLRRTYGFEALPQSATGRQLLVAQFLQAAVLDPGRPTVGAGSSVLIVLNPGPSEAQVSVTYDGAAGTCAGRRMRHGPVTVPGRGIVMFDGRGVVGSPMPEPLPDGCRAAATIAATSEIAVVVVTFSSDASGVAAYVPPRAGGYSAAIPFWRKQVAAGGPQMTVIEAYNYGDAIADAYLYLLDEDGYGIACGSDCQAMIPPRSVHTWSLSAMGRVAADTYGAAILDSYEPLVAVVAELGAAGEDLVSYHAMAVDLADWDAHVPLVRVDTEPRPPATRPAYPEPATATPEIPTEPPTATTAPTSTPTRTPTSSPTPTARAGRPGSCSPSQATVDPSIRSRVPMVAIADGLANPSRVEGWCQPRNMAIPYHPLFNPYRLCLSIKNPAVPYHPLFNGLVYKAGCR